MATLIKFHKNWADEFDVECFMVIDKPIEKITSAIDKFIAANDAVDFGTRDCLGGFCLQQFSIKEMTRTEMYNLINLFDGLAPDDYFCFGVGIEVMDEIRKYVEE
jgi:hypothetical protein